MDDLNNKELCLNLMLTNTEDEIIELLKNAGYWDNPKVWRYYGDRQSNYNTIGNQQSSSVPALVEKLVNSIDATLINACLIKGIDPESSRAPKTIREAVAAFFDNDSKSSTAGLIREWTDSYRTSLSKFITLAATGAKPGKGNPCFIIADKGEGQTPRRMPETLLSLDKENKVKIPFVQGKFNMGGTGVLDFCGSHNFQLILSRRNPSLLNSTNSYDAKWGFTIVRRENPEDGRKTSVYTYLAPLDSDDKPRKGDVLSFAANSMKIFPEGRNPYGRSSEWGTCIKLYEYSTVGFSGSNIMLELLYHLNLSLTELALPIRLYECRDYGGKAGSFETNLTGISVRLSDDKRKNLEEEPYTCSLNIKGEKLKANIYVFKKDQCRTLKGKNGILFTINGQTHATLPESFFRRKKVKLDYLADSLLVIVNCDDISPRSREILFMPSRDRMKDSELREVLEQELEEIIGTHEGLKALAQKRQLELTKKRLSDDMPLEKMLSKLISKSPTLARLFNDGQRLSNPYNLRQSSNEDKPFEGKRFPTYFKIRNHKSDSPYVRNTPKNLRSRILFETDAENSYFGRDVQPGIFVLYMLVDGKNMSMITQ